MPKSLQEQLKALSKKIENDSQKSYTVYELFSKDYLESVHINEDIEDIFRSANVNITHFPNIVDSDYLQLGNILIRHGFNSWDDFLESAKKYQSLKQLKAKGYSTI